MSPLLVRHGNNETRSRLVLSLLILVLTATDFTKEITQANRTCMKLYRKTMLEKESRTFKVNTESPSQLGRGRCRGLNGKDSLIRACSASSFLTLTGIGFKLLRASIAFRTCNIVV